MILPSTRYALIACRYLVGAYYENRYVLATEIAEHYNMDIRMLILSLNRLVRADILCNVAGESISGYILHHHPTEIRLVDVITALEGKRPFVCCREVISSIRCDCETPSDCPIYYLINHTILTAKAKLTKLSLADYCAPNRKEV